MVAANRQPKGRRMIQVWTRPTPNGHKVHITLEELGLPYDPARRPFIAQAVIVCEGATEIGLVRGLDLRLTQSGEPGLALLGISVTDGNGQNMWRRAAGFAKLGYPTALLRDADKFAPIDELAFIMAGGKVLTWDVGLSTEPLPSFRSTAGADWNRRRIQDLR